MSPTLCSIDFSHVMRFNDILQKAISDEFLRFESYLKNACKRFVMELKPTFITDDNPNKNINVAFYNLPLIKRLRELTTSEIGKLVSVAGVVTRTSEVRPELLQGTFKCLDCGTVIKNVEQQFKYTEGLIAAACGQLDSLLKKGGTPTHGLLASGEKLHRNGTTLANGSLDGIYRNGNGVHVQETIFC
ncbi:hypothetical protein KY285_007089 [Solanum tuberosum]|nr:hypothetical protein KY285_007089 [Solanum tuberosum]